MSNLDNGTVGVLISFLVTSVPEKSDSPKSGSLVSRFASSFLSESMTNFDILLAKRLTGEP